MASTPPRGDEGWAQLSDFLGKGDSESAAHPYEQMRARLASFFRWKGCVAVDEYVDATFERVARTLHEGTQVREPEHPSKYVLGVARFIYLERSKNEIRQKKAERLVGEAQALPADPQHLARLQAMEDCLRPWPEEERELLLRYHDKEGKARILARQGLAQKEGIALNTLRIRMHRLRQKLAKCVQGKIS